MGLEEHSAWRIAPQAPLGLLVLLLASSALVSAAAVEDFITACQSSTNFEESICKCMAEKAQKRLSPPGFDFVTASMQKDDQETSRLRSELSFGELMATGTFLADTPAECAGGYMGYVH